MNLLVLDIITKLEGVSLNQPRLTTVFVDPTKYVGKWRLIVSENFDKYVKELVVGIMVRKKIALEEAESSVKPVMDIEVNGEHWKITYTSASRIARLEFDLDKEFEVTLASGRKKKNTYHFVGGKLNLESKKMDPKDTSSKSEWQVEDGMLVVTMETETGVMAQKIYQRI